jgi:hypothetical protein
MPYTRPYSGGFVDYPSTTTPINSTALNTMDVGIKTANDQFQTVTTTQRGSLSPTVGQCVWDSDLRQLMVFMNAAGGNAWQPIGNAIVCTSTTRPSTPFEGQVIRETDTNKELTYSGTCWVQTNSWGTTSGVTGVNNLIVPPAAKIRLTSAVNALTGAWTLSTAVFGASTAAKDIDTDSMVTLATDGKINITTPGMYVVSGGVQFSASATGQRILSLYRTRGAGVLGIGQSRATSGTSILHTLNATGLVECQSGDFLAWQVYQDSGITLTLNTDTSGYEATFLSAVWVGRTS